MRREPRPRFCQSRHRHIPVGPSVARSASRPVPHRSPAVDLAFLRRGSHPQIADSRRSMKRRGPVAPRAGHKYRAALLQRREFFQRLCVCCDSTGRYQVCVKEPALRRHRCSDLSVAVMTLARTAWHCRRIPESGIHCFARLHRCCVGRGSGPPRDRRGQRVRRCAALQGCGLPLRHCCWCFCAAVGSVRPGDQTTAARRQPRKPSAR